MRASIIVSVLMAILGLSIIDAKHIYVRYKRSLEREGDPVPSKESTVVAQGDDMDSVHKSVRDFSNEIANNEKGGKDFFEFDYNPRKDLFQFSGHVPQMFRSPHMQLFEKMMQQMLAQTQAMFQNFPVASFQNYPKNYNGTTESEVIIGGRRFRKKERIINKATGDSQLSIISTIYEPVDEDDVEATTLTSNTANKDGVTEGPVISY